MPAPSPQAHPLPSTSLAAPRPRRYRKGMNAPAISIRGLEKTYAGGKQALKGIDLDIPRGSMFGLLGPNGAGKSTLINILAGLVNKTGGTANIWGFDIDAHPRNAKRSIGIVPQELVFDAFFTPFETLELQAGLFGVAPKDRPLDGVAQGRPSRGQGACLFAHAVGRHEAPPAGGQGAGPHARRCWCSMNRPPASTSNCARSSGPMSANSTPPAPRWC